MKLEKKNVYRSKPRLCVKPKLPSIIENVTKSKNCYIHQNRNPFQSALFFAVIFMFHLFGWQFSQFKKIFPDASYETSMHTKLSVPCQKITVYTSDTKKLMLTCFTRRTWHPKFSEWCMEGICFSVSWRPELKREKEGRPIQCELTLVTRKRI